MATRFHHYVYLALHLTYFSQYKYNAGGKLDAGNYSTAHAASLIKQVVTNHHSGKSYKDLSLSTACIPLKKKKNMARNRSIELKIIPF